MRHRRSVHDRPLLDSAEADGLVHSFWIEPAPVDEEPHPGTAPHAHAHGEGAPPRDLPAAQIRDAVGRGRSDSGDAGPGIGCDREHHRLG